MKKSRFILVALVATLIAGFAFAKTVETPAGGAVGYLYNEATGMFVSATATTEELGTEFVITDEGLQEQHFGSGGSYVEDPGYTYIRFKASSTGEYLKMGSASVSSGTGYHKWAVKPVDDALAIRCIYTPTQDNNALPYAKQGWYLAVGQNGLELVEEYTDAAKWQFLTEDEYKKIEAAVLKKQAEEEAKAAAELKAKKAAILPGDDVTFALADAQFDNGGKGWTINNGKIEKKGTAANYVVTAYGYTFDISQTITDLKPGVYKLQAQAFSRSDANATVWAKALAGEEQENYTVIYGNGAEQKVALLTDDHLTEKPADGSWSELQDADGSNIYLPNNAVAFAQVFTLGMYDNELTVEVGEDGVLTLGVKNTTPNAGTSYAGYDNFRLTFVSFSEKTQKDYAAAVKYAKNISGQYSNTLKTALENAIATYAAEDYDGDLATATAALRKAADDAVASIVAYKGIKACYESNKQFLPESHVAEFEEAVADVLAGLEAGTIEGDGMKEMEIIVRALTVAQMPVVLDTVEVGTTCIVNQNYKPGAAHGVTIDWEAIATQLGTDKDGLKVYSIMPDGTLDENFGVGSKGTDGWRDAEGNWVNWGTDARFYVQFKTADDPLAITAIGAMNTPNPATYTAHYKVVNANDTEGDWVALNISLDVQAEPIYTPADFAKKGEANLSVTVDNSANDGAYAGPYYFTDFDEAAIAQALGLENLDAETVDLWSAKNDEEGSLTNSWTATYGYWMAADGTPLAWGTADMAFYVEWNEGKLYTSHSDALTAGEEVEYTATLYIINQTEVREDGTQGDLYQLNITFKYAEPTFEGVKYLYNETAGLYWGAGNSWGTQASLVKNPEFVTLALLEDGTYTLESQVSNGGTQYYFNGDYMDNGSPVSLTITKVEGGFTIGNGDALYGYDGNSTVLGKNITGDAAIWQIISEADMRAELEGATVDNPVNATWLILDPNFGRNNRNASAWTFEASNKNISGGNNTNNNAESYHAVFTLSQTLNDVPNGVYALTAQGFYRQDGSDNDNLPYFFLNDGTVTFPVKTGSENSMSDASGSFTNGLYTVEPIIVKVEDGTITLGAKNEANTSLWCIWDNFVLTYYGADATVEQVAALANVAAYEKAVADAEAVDQSATIAPSILEALQTALADYSNLLEGEYTAESLAEATEALKAATEAANNSLKNGDAIVAMKALMDDTNVYTAEALEAYNQVYEDYYERWNAGTLTETVVNPNTVAGWHSSNIFDDLLLSAWTIGGNQCADFNTSLYINTWSVEADGKENSSEVHVPFFEYWTGDANSLGANALEATLTDLPAGAYEVEALVRVRIKNNVEGEPYGISLSVNDGEAIDVAAGETCGDGDQFRYGTYTAAGEVGEDGVLKIKFDVAEDNNISWLSFKNVKYTKVGGDSNPDAPETEVPYGWKTLIANGNFAGEEVANYFWASTTAEGLQTATIENGIGVDGGHGIKVSTPASHSNGYETQFFIKANEPIAGGTQIRIEFDCRAASAASPNTQGHVLPQQYLAWSPFGNVNFTTEWAHYSWTGTAPNPGNDGPFQTFVIDLGNSDNNTFYFDNIVFWVEDAEAGVKDATAINGIAGDQKVEGIFNANGQKLNELQKGLNIVNGKKVYVK